jgi:hypothetical protein
MDNSSTKATRTIQISPGGSIKVSTHLIAGWTSDPYVTTCISQHWETWTFPEGGTFHIFADKPAQIGSTSSSLSANPGASPGRSIPPSSQEVKFAHGLDSKGQPCRLVYFNRLSSSSAERWAIQVLEAMAKTETDYIWMLNYVTCPAVHDFSAASCTVDAVEELSIPTGDVPLGILWTDRMAVLGNMICGSILWKRVQGQGHPQTELNLLRDELSFLLGQMIISYDVGNRTRGAR